jgi:hypothetical protein
MLSSLLKILVGVAIGVPLFMWAFQERMIFIQRPLESRPAPRPGLGEVTIPVGDGVRLRGWLVKAMGGPPAPLVIYFGGNAEEVSWLVETADRLAGWSLLLVNYRGYGESEGKPASARCFRTPSRSTTTRNGALTLTPGASSPWAGAWAAALRFISPPRGLCGA